MRTFRAWPMAPLALLLALLGLAATAPTARADDTPDSWRIVRYATDATVAKDGTAQVRTEVDFDFTHDPGHGPYLTFVTRNAIEGDRGHWRAIDVDDIHVTSPTGANTDVQTESDGGALLVRVGTEDRKYTGVQKYVVTYRLRGIVEPADRSADHLDEVNWAAIGDGWQVPLDDVSVTLHLPRATTMASCRTHRPECTVDGHATPTNTYRVAHLARQESLQVVAGLPAGTFVGAEPRLEHRIDPVRALDPLGVNGLAAVVLAVVGWFLVHRARSTTRDLVHAGQVPGLAPADGQAGPIVPADPSTPVAVRFTPPDGVTPGEAGTLVDAKADTEDVVATVVDLAVRGHLRMERLPAKGGRKGGQDDQWRITHVHGDETDLLAHERRVIACLFDGTRGTVTTRQLADDRGTQLLSKGKEELYAQVTDRRRWFRDSPTQARMNWLVTGGLVTAAGVALAVLGVTTFDAVLPGVVVAALGLVVLVLSDSAPSRTPSGSTVQAQTQGFRLYLTTAEADTIRLDEQTDVFSRYLPWAIAFGVAERWTALFEQLAAQGRCTPDLYWCGGHHGSWGNGSLGSLSSSLTSAMSSSMACAQASSASTGGGGFGGGGGGGW